AAVAADRPATMPMTGTHMTGTRKGRSSREARRREASLPAAARTASAAVLVVDRRVRIPGLQYGAPVVVAELEVGGSVVGGAERADAGAADRCTGGNRTAEGRAVEGGQRFARSAALRDERLVAVVFLQGGDGVVAAILEGHRVVV